MTHLWMSTRQSECVGAGSLVPPIEECQTDGSTSDAHKVWIDFGIFPCATRSQPLEVVLVALVRQGHRMDSRLSGIHQSLEP
jgi:hypothetical protein